MPDPPWSLEVAHIRGHGKGRAAVRQAFDGAPLSAGTSASKTGSSAGFSKIVDLIFRDHLQGTIAMSVPA